MASMVDQGEVSKGISTTKVAENAIKQTIIYPRLELKDVPELAGKKPGDECTISVNVRLKSMRVGQEYGDNKDTTPRYTVEVLSAGVKNGKKGHDYSKSNGELKARAEKLVEQSEDRD